MKPKFKLRRWTYGIVTALALLLVHASGQDAKTIEITAKRFSYEPASITVKKGEPVTLVLKSEDVAHGLRFSEFNLNLKAQKGESTKATFTPDKTGDFTGHCSVFCGSGHGSMALTMHVVN